MAIAALYAITRACIGAQLQGTKEEEWRGKENVGAPPHEAQETLHNVKDYWKQVYIVMRESMLMASVMPGAYLHAFLASGRGLAAANAAATIYCTDNGKTPCERPSPRALVQPAFQVLAVGASAACCACKEPRERDKSRCTCADTWSAQADPPFVKRRCNGAAGVARTTAALVRMGHMPLIRDTVVVACDGGRADVVAAITMALLALREVCIVTQINNALVSAGHIAAGAKITGAGPPPLATERQSAR